MDDCDVPDAEHDRALARREQQRIQEVFEKAGFREGLEAGKHAFVQQGFDRGFHEGAAAGLTAGLLRGRIHALLALAAARGMPTEEHAALRRRAEEGLVARLEHLRAHQLSQAQAEAAVAALELREWGGGPGPGAAPAADPDPAGPAAPRSDHGDADSRGAPPAPLAESPGQSALQVIEGELQAFLDAARRGGACLAEYHNIRNDFARKLRALERYEIVALFDDSGSMASECQSGGGLSDEDPFAPIQTRWGEAQRHAAITVDLAACLDVDGIDIRFLNRPGFRNVTETSQVAAAFAPPPKGYTPLTRAVQDILAEKAGAERDLLLIILTDGEPTDDEGDVLRDEFVELLMSKPDNVYVSIVACTDDARVMAFLNQLDDLVPRLDVVDDYESEKAEVLAAQGAGFAFSFGDYVAKTLLGPIDPTMDDLDKRPGAASGAEEASGDDATSAPAPSAPPAPTECSVCMDQQPDTALNCGHVFCSGCASAVQRCPKCRVAIAARIKLFS